MQQKKWLDEKHKIPTNKMTKPRGGSNFKFICIEKHSYLYYLLVGV